jgi:hypothetical protein
MQSYVRAFVAGFLSTLVFHQGMLGLFHLLGVVPRMPWNVDGVPPFGVPAVISLAFWGGIWGIPIWYLMRHATNAAYWVRAIVFGAIGPTVVALLVVYPLKDRPFAADWDIKIWVLGLILNGAWGLGLALFMRGLKRVGV